MSPTVPSIERTWYAVEPTPTGEGKDRTFRARVQSWKLNLGEPDQRECEHDHRRLGAARRCGEFTARRLNHEGGRQ